jgi:hypothetical protein
MRGRDHLTAAGMLLAAVLLLPAGASAKAPPGRYVLDAETVTDATTGLRWQRGTSATKANRQGAAAYCAQLSLGTGPAMGAGSWRLPTIRELTSIVDRRATQPAIDTAAFPGTKFDLYWSSTHAAGKPGLGWGIAFSQGDTYFQQPTYTGWVRCVQTLPAAKP